MLVAIFVIVIIGLSENLIHSSKTLLTQPFSLCILLSTVQVMKIWIDIGELGSKPPHPGIVSPYS